MVMRYYAQRATTGEWLDTSVALSDPLLTWVLSGPDAGKAMRPSGIGNPIAEDGKPLFGKWDTLLLAEEDGKLEWFGICTNASPTAKGTDLEFIGLAGWLAGVPYTGEYQVWRTPLWEVIRELMSAARGIPDGLKFKTTFKGGDGFFVGDPQPPGYPETGPRTEGHTDELWSSHTAAVRNAQEAWRENHGWKQQYELVWWDAPMVGRELDDLIKQYGFGYTSSIRWTNRTKLEYEINLDFSDEVRYRRMDVEFIDGVNLAKPIDIKAGTSRFANRAIGLGAGEGRDMLRVDVGGKDGRLYQAEILPYKAINNATQLRNMTQADLKLLKSDDVRIDTLTVWDMPGFAPLKTLRPGDEVKVTSRNTIPEVNGYSRIVSITRDPNEAVAVINFEVAS